MNKKVQAKNIPDEVCLDAVKATQGMHGVAHWSCLWDIEDALGQYPTKVVKAKLAVLIKKGKISGCLCGCRGDFEIL
jgi:hypothetical protein